MLSAKLVVAQWVPMYSCLTVLPAVSDPRKVESNPGKHESCPIRVIFREDARVAIRQGHAALTRVGRVRDCDVSNPLVNLVAVTPTGVVSEKRGKPLRSRTFGVVSLHGGIRHAANLGWREEPWGRGEHGSRSPHGGDAGASAITPVAPCRHRRAARSGGACRGESCWRTVTMTY